ncbi:MAG: hypothetical protein MUP22_02525, partial [Desulfobacterales bacterium]|nr:hypothetical protein [Desulfobacterales bacterium]
MYNNDLINTFLHYSYLPEAEPNNIYFERIINCTRESIPEIDDFATVDIKDLINIGVKYLKKTLESKVVANKTNIVPLSGGLDSRAILAAL